MTSACARAAPRRRRARLYRTHPHPGAGRPAVLAGRDLLGGAQTGTGKTAGFTLPLLQRLAHASERERIAGAASGARADPGADARARGAGAGKRPHLRQAPAAALRSRGLRRRRHQPADRRRCKRGVDILVATPGRLLDHVAAAHRRPVAQVEILVLDEADRMLDMGFIPDIRNASSRCCPSSARTCCSRPPSPTRSASSPTASCTTRSRSKSRAATPPPSSIAQRVHPVDRGTQARAARAPGRQTNDWQQVLVFTRTKHGANRLAEQLDARRHRRRRDPRQQEPGRAHARARATSRRARCRVLVATDIAARGLDIDELPHVVNFDLPHVPEDYVHRIGRTGRAGSTGEAVSLVCGEDRPLLAAIERLIEQEDRGAHGRRLRCRASGQRQRCRRRRAARARPRPRRAPRRAAAAARAAAARAGTARRAAQEQRSGAKPAQEKRAKPAGETRGGQGGRGEARRRGGRGESKREERGPRYATSPAARTSGNSGGMDFNKPYEPSTPAMAAAPEQSGESPPRKRGSTAACRALFKRKAA